MPTASPPDSSRLRTAAPLIISGRGSSLLKRVGAGVIDRFLPGRRVRQAFRAQAVHCDALGSPFTALLCRLTADRLDASTTVGAMLLGWRSHPGNDALPLRFAGALHALVLSGRDTDLAALYPPAPMPALDRLWDAVRETMVREADFVAATLRVAPQTNEVARSGALLGGFLSIAAATGKPLFLSELGASAGLNLFWDRFGYEIGGATWGDPAAAVRLAPRWTGGLPPLAAPVSIAGRAGCDLNRLKAADPADGLRLQSYVWAGQPERMERLRAALRIAAAGAPAIANADAADWLETRLAEQPAGTAHVVYHTIVWQYLPEPIRARIEAALGRAGAAASDERPLAWLRLEPDNGKPPGAALTLTQWPSGVRRTLARADFHGRWVDWSG